ncbi:keratin, type I cytoskeletal 18-like [Pan paniscus]|uniref:keratin, type I cytoskeletal 18-like n=1 Tax=Pan paniscus TaxID=9597 RepID=UPI002436F087|nr:keratin, type I cytoskeletal 18-like [Pan paniscus]XP_054963072.1 keratin, type I cytoskeletal 18-like [Pan paniscus]XP_054963073.1 keratin, type I cytoskeletal 18-like [Pan paniscus]XP_054963075.1 keratin, type I cytoskeletal 18-like [Pan paniscus]
MEVDVPKSQDLGKIMAGIQAQYDEMAENNREELDKYWCRQTEESTTVFTMQSTEIGAAERMLRELRCTVQSLDIDLDSMRYLKATLENSLREVDADGGAQQDPAAPGVRADPNPGREAPGPRARGPVEHQGRAGG